MANPDGVAICRRWTTFQLLKDHSIIEEIHVGAGVVNSLHSFVECDVNFCHRDSRVELHLVLLNCQFNHVAPATDCGP